MALALAAVRVVLIVAAIGIVVVSGVRPATAQTVDVTLSVDDFLVNICEDVEFTVDITGLSGGGKTFNYFEIDEYGERRNIGNTLNVYPMTHSYTYNQCAPGPFAYQVEIYRKIGLANTKMGTSNGLVVQWLHPAQGGTQRVHLVADGETYTNVPPVITSLEYDDPENVSVSGDPVFDATVHVKWTPVEHANGYQVIGASPNQQQAVDTTDSEAAATQASVTFNNIFPNQERDAPVKFQVLAQFENGEQSVVILNTPSGLVAIPPSATVNSPASETASVVVRREGSNPPIDTSSAGEPSTVAPGFAPEGINEVARLIAQHTGMGAGAATTLLPLLCLLLAGGAAAVVVLPLGFSPLSLAAGFLVFTLVWSVGGVAWFGLPIAVAALPPVLLAASGVMIVRRRGMFG